jgi:hypothetical protein
MMILSQLRIFFADSLLPDPGVIFSLFHNRRKVELINNAGRMNARLCYIDERIDLHVIQDCAWRSTLSSVPVDEEPV